MSSQGIFLSYASQDADAARRICDALRAAGLEVWFDQSELRGGDAWDASIRKQIKECALFVPIVSHNTNAREEGYFRLEWKLAVDRSHLMADNHTFFFPVILGDVAEPAALVPEKFRERQWTRLNDDAAINAFAQRVAKVHNNVQAGGASSSKSASSHPSNGEVGGLSETLMPVVPAQAGTHSSSSSQGQPNLDPGLPLRGLRHDGFKSGAQGEHPQPSRSAMARRRTIVALASIGAATASGLAIWRPWQGGVSGQSSMPRDPQLARANDLLDSIGSVASDAVLAEELVKGVLATRPTDPEAVIMMCRVQLYILQRGFDRRETRFASAKEFAEKAFTLAPENPVAKVCMADYLLRRSLDSERALQLVEEAIATQPEVPRYHRLRNTIRGSLSRFSRSERSQFYSATAEQFPQDTLAQHDAALSFLTDAQFTEAKIYLRRAIALGPQASSGPTLAGIEMWADGDLVSAKATLDRVSAKQRTAARAIIVQFWYAMLSGDTAFGQTALRAHPEPWVNDFFFTGPAALLYGELLLREGKAMLATPYFEQAYAEWVKHKQELVNQGRHAWLEPYLLFRLGKVADARSRNAVALTTVPRPYQLPFHNDWWMFRSIAVNLMLGERDNALALMREAASSPAGKQVMRNAFKLDPRMAPFRNDKEIVALLAESEQK